MSNDPRYTLSRRAFMSGTAGTLANIAASTLMAKDGLESHGGAGHAPRAKRVIYLDMAGAPPQLDMFDYKPKLVELDRTLCPKEFIEGKRLAFIKGHPKLLGPPHPFVQMGERGHHVTALMPNFASIIDEVAMIHSMHTDEFNHAQADLFIQTGSNQPGSASLGSWATWGLGSENQDLPGFIVLNSGGSDPTGGSSLWSSGFLPSSYQGVRCRAAGDPILYVSNPSGVDASVRRRTLDAVRELKWLGVPTVYMVYRGDEARMSGYHHEWHAARVEAVWARWGTQPIGYESEGGQVTAIRCIRCDEKKQPMPDTEHAISCELVLLAIGQSKLDGLVADLDGIATDRGRIVVDDDRATGRAGYYAGGDCINGGKEVVNATADGGLAADAIHAWLGAGNSLRGK